MKRNLFYAIIIIATMVACNNNDFLAESNMPNNPVEELSAVEKAYLADPEASVLREFGKALYSAMSESPMLREIIKTEAVKQFDKDYDVLYQLIKNREVEDGLTVSKLLLKHFDDAATLMRIEARCPLLTIFVPVLPEDSFSAETWNPAEQVPAVAIHTKHYNIPVISEYGFCDENSDEFVVAAGYIPAFPVVVLKQNERVIVARDGVQTQSAGLNSTGSNFNFEFIDDCFDGSKTENVLQRAVLAGAVDQKVRDAYTIYENADGWQRDYIYYGLTPSNTTGPFCYDFEEMVTSFRFSPNASPAAILAKISDATADPALIPLTTNTNFPWTDGYFEFRIYAEIGTKAQITPTKTIFFHASPNELFEVTFTKKFSFVIDLYEPKVTGFKTKDLTGALMNWNLENFSPIMKISISEFDLSETLTITSTNTVEFAGNIGGDFKDGLKFGASAKHTQTTTFTQVSQLGSDELGEVLVNFADKIVTSTVNSTGGIIIPIIYNIRDYYNDVYSITVEPVRVQ